MAGPFTITSVSNYNVNPPSDDGAQTASNRVQWSTQKQKLADPIFNAFNTSETNTSNAFGKVKGGAGITTTAVSYTVAASDQGKYVKATASGITITTPDATVVGSPFLFSVVNDSTGNISFAGNGSQTIDGSSIINIPQSCGLEVNTDGSNWLTDGQNFNNVSGILNYISGLTLSTAGGSGTFGIAAGVANDSTNAKLMQLTSAYTKTTASWAVGTGNGGLDTGAIANSTWYHVFEIMRTDTGVVDILFSTSTGTPTLPTNYTLFRRIGSMRTDTSAHWILFSQFGNEFIWSADDGGGSPFANGAIGTTASSLTPTVPTGIKMLAIVRVQMIAPGASATNLLVSPLDQSDQNPSSVFNLSALGTNVPTAGEFIVRTSTSAQIRMRSSTALTTVLGTTKGWIDYRGQQ